jgi:hypothetical protein
MLYAPSAAPEMTTIYRATEHHVAHFAARTSAAGGTNVPTRGVLPRNVSVTRSAFGWLITRIESGRAAAGHLADLAQLTAMLEMWDGDAPAPNALALDGVRGLIDIVDIESIGAETRVLASADGGAALVFAAANLYADIEFTNDGEVLAALSDGASMNEVWALDNSEESLRTALQRIGEFFTA